MCIAAWIWQSHPVYKLLLVFNRDELLDRPTKPVGWWGEGCNKILGGRDVQGGGTWLGCTKDGRLAFLTNVLEPDVMAGAKTRGELPVRFLQSKKSPEEFAKEVAKEADDYNGFNLILADLCANIMVYVSNRPKGEEAASIQLVSPGLHVLSNAKLDSPWHKAQRLRKSFRELLWKHGDEEIPPEDLVEKLMRDTTKAAKDMLPNTGCNADCEFNLSSIFVDINTTEGHYGTRSTDALLVNSNGNMKFYEKYIDSGVWKDLTMECHIMKM